MLDLLDLNLLLEQAFNGLIIAIGIYLVASGLSLVYGMLGVPNFAHGSLYMYGAFLLFTVTRLMFGNTPWLFWVGLLLVPFIVMVLGMGIEVVLLRPIYRADAFYQLLLTYGLVLIFGDLVKMIWGTENQAVSRPPGFEGSMSLFDISFPSYQTFVLIPISMLTIVMLYLFIHKTGLAVSSARSVMIGKCSALSGSMYGCSIPACLPWGPGSPASAAWCSPRLALFIRGWTFT
nr:branched-chain amino acid ABC transporter permease [Candidatus Entotheonella palauensis]